MIKIHHLNNSRSQRILWLAEELELDYEIVRYQRQSPVPLAPPELKKIHPLGKSPVMVDGATTIAESGAIVEYLIDVYGKGRFRPAHGTTDYWKYVEWMHYAEGSAMLPLMLALYAGTLGDGAAPLRPRIDSEIANHFGYMEDALKGRSYFVGDGLTGADIQLLFVLEAAGDVLEGYPRLRDYRARMQARPAYGRAITKGGPYDLAQNRARE
ncbi:MAG: glutathione S-transferase family protein [Rhizomicrobium sp.]